MPRLIKNGILFGKRVLKLAISILFFICGWLWNRTQTLFGKNLPGTCVVLYYHAVPLEHRNRFAEQMDLIVHYARPVRSDRREPLQTGVNHAAVVFHDAFLSVYDHALPEMASRGIPTTLFVPTGYMGKHPGWMMEHWYADHTEIVIDADRLKSLDPALVSIGSHTVTHSDLSQLGEGEALEELRRSKLELEAILGRPVDLFAFPFGGYSNDLERLCRQAGYARIFTIEPLLAFREPDEYVTGSCGANTSDWSVEFRMKLLGAYRWLPHISRLRGRIKGALKLGRSNEKLLPHKSD